MKHIKFFIFFAFTSALFLGAGMPAAANASNCGKKNKKLFVKKNPIVGSYALSVSGLNGNLAFDAGGTVHGQLEADAGAGNPFVPEGAFGTVWTGDWKRGCSRWEVEFVITNVIISKECDLPCIPGVATARSKILFSVAFSEDFSSFTGTVIGQFFDVNDLTFTRPLGPPSNFTVEGRRVNF